jgi:hypothetical protein
MSHKTLIVFALLGALSCLAQRGFAEDQSSVHQGRWPIQNGFNRQPTDNNQDVTSGQASEIDRLYDQLMSSGDKGKDYPSGEPAR